MKGSTLFIRVCGRPGRPFWTSEVAIFWRVIAILILALCVFSAVGKAQQLNLSQDVYRFDAGPVGTTVETGAAALNLETCYTSEVGVGWTIRPRNGFQRPELSRSRSAMTIDGVSGQQVGFRADVTSGVWFVTLWMEAGRDDASPLNLTIQGRERTLGWQRFLPPAEPTPAPPKIYRVFHGIAAVETDGLSFELIGGQDEVRFLGCSLIRQVNPTTSSHRRLVEKLTLAGRYNRGDPLDELASEVEQSLHRDRTDAFLALWLERLRLLATAERYLSMRGWESANKETGLGLFNRLHQAVMLSDGLLSTETREANPLAERALYTRGRILYWLGKERLGEHEIAGGERDLAELYERHPDDKLLAMYNGRRIDLPDACDCLETISNVPAWSVAQREALCRMRQLADWWVNERQTAGGEFGGKLGDDVELLRWWVPLVLSGDETAKRGWQTLADGVWASKHVHEGYARDLGDVEHASEFVADTAPLMVMFSDDPRYVDRLACSSKHFETLWTGKTAQGHRFFRSAWFSSTALATEEPKGRDLEYNTRAVQAVRYLAWRRSDPQVVTRLHEWSSAWASAAMRTDKGKPRGIIPASVRFIDEAINGDEPTWYRANMFWDYYDWEHAAGSMMLDQLFFTYTLTKDEQLLTPMFLALELIRSEEAGPTDSSEVAYREGSRAWTAAQLIRSDLFWSVVEQWRFLSGDSRWDDLILRHGTPYGRYRLSGDEHHLVDGLSELLDDVRYNTPLKTNEAIHTDRVYVPGSDHLKAMLTGDGIWASISPYFAASWEQTDEDFTALVRDSGWDRLTAQLYSHSPDERRIVLRIWQLVAGEYRLRLEHQGHESQVESITVQDRGQRIRLTLPGQRLVTLSLERIP